MKLRITPKNHLILGESLWAGARLPTATRSSRYFFLNGLILDSNLPAKAYCVSLERSMASGFMASEILQLNLSYLIA